MKTLLVTTDLSANSKSAIRFAVQLATQTNVQLVFYYMAEVTKPTSWTDSHYASYRKAIETKYSFRLKAFVEKTLGFPLRNAVYGVGLNFNVTEDIMSAAKLYQADFICMSTRGAGKVKKLFGTNSSALITRSRIPVIVVPQRYRPEPIKNIFFACDFANVDIEMRTVKTFADDLKAMLNVYHFDYMIDLPETQKRLQKKAAKHISRKVKFHFHKQHIEDSLHEHLSNHIKAERPNLVTLFTKQDRKWYDRLLLPSEASEMSFHLNLPLLTFRKKT
jgi:nucleotide-binding universal stress UspA family protein